MFTEPMLRQHPALIRAFTGIPAEAFWEMLEKMEAQFSDYETGRHTRDGRQRAVGGRAKVRPALGVADGGRAGLFAPPYSATCGCADVRADAV
ncbi:hypothetical protein [Methylovulum psychrotolerans]|uniref:Uncharacterized protein n=1 Tax=Methylovulum psychrotolerans TaxID=1704499 RepID=A0A2S5CKE1_9GAMM|nr:hypothetical protein [Methylovulum psychrotolerans]POZ51285.1 hypothetical protein AADEFJLK_02731 [Methylovulum psychrotolerans]